MPLYEYACDRCGDRFEVMQKFSDEPLTTHAKCGGAVHRLISAPALQFKGSGWYITDYAKGGSPSSPSDNGTPTKTDSSSEKTVAKSDGSATTTSSTATSGDSKPSSSEKK